MANSMLAAVRDAVAGPVEMSSVEDEPRAPGGHAHSQPGGHSMSENDGKPVAKNAGISQAEHDASVEKARGEGHAAGSAEATTRLGDVLGAEGIKGDGGRMAAALDLAVKSPAMAAADVSAYVVANVAANAGASGQDPATYEAERLNAAGLATPQERPGAKKASINRSEIYSARANQSKG